MRMIMVTKDGACVREDFVKKVCPTYDSNQKPNYRCRVWLTDGDTMTSDYPASVISRQLAGGPPPSLQEDSGNPPRHP